MNTTEIYIFKFLRFFSKYGLVLTYSLLLISSQNIWISIRQPANRNDRVLRIGRWLGLKRLRRLNPNHIEAKLTVILGKTKNLNLCFINHYLEYSHTN
jgi:hypothetical protein